MTLLLAAVYAVTAVVLCCLAVSGEGAREEERREAKRGR